MWRDGPVSTGSGTRTVSTVSFLAAFAILWKYLGPILQLPLRFKPSNQWDFGANWECAAFMTLSNENASHDFFILGCEGAKKRDAASDINAFVGYCLWMSGRLTKSDDPKMTYNFGGLLDHGCFYAPSQYEHPVSRKRILWGWIKEEDVTLAHCEEKGWRGMLSLPRELFLLSIPNVVGTLRTPLDQIDSIDTTADDAGLTSVHTMGVRPQGELRDLRARNPVSWSSSICEPIPFPLFQGPHWELEAVIAISAHDESKIGFSIQHNESRSKQTKIYFDTASEEIVVDRSTSNNDDKVIKDVLRGSFNLFKIRKEGKEEMEKLFLRIFCDGNVVEVFANDRFAMSFMVYSDEPGCTALSYLADSSTSVLERFEALPRYVGCYPFSRSSVCRFHRSKLIGQFGMHVGFEILLRSSSCFFVGEVLLSPKVCRSPLYDQSLCSQLMGVCCYLPKLSIKDHA
ncbi:glycoside hydrolase family 32 protein, partial [Aureobasidium melanogenum]